MTHTSVAWPLESPPIPRPADDELIGPEEAARRLGVSRATVYNWIDSRRLLGWRLTRQGTLIPAEQILGRGEVVPGIERVLEILPVGTQHQD